VLNYLVFSGLLPGGYSLGYIDPYVSHKAFVLRPVVGLQTAIHASVCLAFLGAICKLS
jgi:hypothetical protein